MLISEVARSSGLSVDTIRFYEKRELIDPAFVVRRENNYKEYAATTVQRLRLIKSVQAAGFTLTEIGKMVKEWETDALTAEEKKTLFTRKVEQIQERIEELERVKAYLQQKIGLLQIEQVVVE